MREVLYRGIPKNDCERHFFTDIWKNHCKNSFVYGSLIVENGKYYICVSALFKLNCCINNGIISMIEVIPETVGQYTGLTDKSGEKIFEGDIVQYYGTYPLEVYIEKGHTKIRWYDTITTSNCDELFFSIDREGYGECEVIGNIHDNPELLKGGAE